MGDDGYSNPFSAEQRVCQKGGDVVLVLEECRGIEKEDSMESSMAIEDEESWGLWTEFGHRQDTRVRRKEGRAKRNLPA